jgi:hypothetical protein
VSAPAAGKCSKLVIVRAILHDPTPVGASPSDLRRARFSAWASWFVASGMTCVKAGAKCRLNVGRVAFAALLLSLSATLEVGEEITPVLSPDSGRGGRSGRTSLAVPLAYLRRRGTHSEACRAAGLLGDAAPFSP